jgi:hypothetical protein
VRRQPPILINSLVDSFGGFSCSQSGHAIGVSGLRQRGEQELLNVGVPVVDIAEVLVAIRVTRAAAMPSEP